MNILPKLDDILINEYGDEYKVLAVCGHVVTLSQAGDFTKATLLYTLEELNERGYTLKVPEEKWVPENEEEYWYMSSTYVGCLIPLSSIWMNDDLDNARLNSPLGICPTKEAMQEKIDWAVNKLKS
jgi:hypothetical protein